MKIPDEVKQFVCRLEQKKKPKFEYILPKCNTQLGHYAQHRHDANGNCIVKNWSNDAVNYVNKKGQSK